MMKFLILLLCTGALAQRPSLGKCPKLKVVQDFDVDKYLGTWFEVGRAFVLTELGGKCTKAEYSLNEDGTIRVLNTQVNSLTGITSSIEGTAKLVGKDGEGKLSISFPSLPVKIEGNLSILDTDYSEYAVLYSCQDFHFFNTKQAWILTREPIPFQDVLLKAEKVLERNGLNRKYIVHTNQEDCN